VSPTRRSLPIPLRHDVAHHGHLLARAEFGGGVLDDVQGRAGEHVRDDVEVVPVTQPTCRDPLVRREDNRPRRRLALDLDRAPRRLLDLRRKSRSL